MLVVVVLLLAVAGVRFVVSHYDPRRERPMGWNTPWASIPLEPEASWAVDPLKRGVMQRAFMDASAHLTECSQEFSRTKEGGVAQLEVLLETTAAGTRVMFVEPTPKPELPPTLLTCIERALERTAPVATPGLPAGTKWRLSLTFLLPPLDELVTPPWWEALVPESFRSGGSSAIHVG